MTAPFGGGIGPQSYSGVTGPFEAIPSNVPDIIQPGEEVISPTTIDPTMAGMATVSQNYGDFSPHMGMLGDMVSNQPTVDYSIVTDDPTRPVVTDTPFFSNMPEITPLFESNMPTAYPVTDPVSVMETAQMLGSDPALQAGDDFFRGW
jgi:hypothetical protein